MPEIFTSAGTIPTTIQGLVSNFVASAPRLPIGERPLAVTLPIGTEFVALDTSYVGIVCVHPKLRDQRVWMTSINQRDDSLATAGVGGATGNRLGVYNPSSRVFTQATVAGQFCNARAASTAVQGASMIASLQMGFLFATIGATPFAIGDELMCDASGLWVPYVDNGVNVPLGICGSFVAAGGSITALQYDW